MFVAMTTRRDIKTEEQLWRDPPWTCPRCKTLNPAIRHGCRECGYVGGECPTHEVDAND